MARSSRAASRIATETLGTSPGTLTYVGKEIALDVRVALIEYNAEFLRETPLTSLDQCQALETPAGQVTWLDVDGIHKPEVVAEIGRRFHLHPLLLEDVLNTQQKPKYEQYEGSVLFVVLKLLNFNPYTREVEQEHVSFVLGPHYVISFQEERNGNVFQPVMERLRASVGKTRRNGPDYLLYALMDVVVDNYFGVLEKVEEHLERLEDDIVRTARPRTQTDLYTLKRDLSTVRRAMWPVREILGSLIRDDDETDLIAASTLPYLRDLYDHATQVVETVDNFRDWVASLLDLYQTALSNRMNNIMKVLTVFSAIFMPLTFVVGIYGMNFDNMPELHWHYGYYLVLGVMVVITGVMVSWFWRKGWL
jgi:magnesium transporter